MSMFRTYRDFQRIPNKNNQIQATSYSCDICEEGDWMSETEVEIHKNTVHLQEIWKIIIDKTKYACMICAKEHVEKKSLYEHIKTEHLLSSRTAERIEREIFICAHCSHLFFNKALLQIHILRKHRDSVSKRWEIECPKCFKLIRKSGIWGHLEFHHIASISTCPICLEKCANRKELNNHLEKHRRYYFCGVCDFETKIENNFKEHLICHRKRRMKTDITLTKYFVPKVLMKLVRSYSVQNVMKGLVLPNNTHICIVCRHICFNASQMKKHLMCDHTTLEEAKKKVNMCECGKVFSNKILLKQHVLKEKDGHRVLEDIEVETAVSETIQTLETDSDSDTPIVISTNSDDDD